MLPQAFASNKLDDLMRDDKGCLERKVSCPRTQDNDTHSIGLGNIVETGLFASGKSSSTVLHNLSQIHYSYSYS